jgi:hypothetical protein
VNLFAPECFSTPENFADIKSGFQVIQDNDTLVASGPGQFVVVSVPAEPALGSSPLCFHHLPDFMGP